VEAQPGAMLVQKAG